MRAKRLTAAHLLSGILLVAASTSAEAREGDARFAIGERPLDEALVAFAVQADVSLATPPTGVGEAQSHAVRGHLRPQEALRQLLRGTNFTFEQIDSVTFRIVPVSAASAPPTQTASTTIDEGEIIVTARRRPEALDRTPASATVISSDQLQQMHVEATSDTAFVAAGLNFTNLGPGRNKIVFRGISDGAFSGDADSTVAIYVDDSRISYGAPDPDLLLTDVSAVEILRGPQGALFGVGSIAGVYRISVNEPDLETRSGFISTGVTQPQDGDIGGNARFMVNLPLVHDRLGVRVVGYGSEEGGWLDNSVLGLRNTNRTTRDGLRATIAARLSDDWTVSARVLHQNIDSSDSQYIDVDVGELARTTRVLEPHDNDFFMASASVRGVLSIGEFSSSTTYIHHGFDSRFDASGALDSWGIAPSAVSAFDDLNELRVLTQEARIVGVAAPFPWSLGVTVSSETRLSKRNLTTSADTSGATVAYAAARRDRSLDYAVYGAVGWPITESMTLELGARAFGSTLRMNSEANGATPMLGDDFRGRRSDYGILPEVQLSYEPAPGRFYYLRVSEGYRSGGFNAGSAAILESAPSAQPDRRYGADRLWNAELGMKLAFFDDRLHLRSALFWAQWQNVQTDQLLAEGLPFTGNLGDGIDLGLETELAWEVAPETMLTAHVTYASPEITHENERFPASSDAALPGAPDLMAGLTFSSARDIGGVGRLRVSASGLYVGRSNITFAETGVTIGDYFDSSLNISLERDLWTLSLNIDNLMNSEGATFSFGNPFRFGADSLVTPLRPRTFGVQLERRF